MKRLTTILLILLALTAATAAATSNITITKYGNDRSYTTQAALNNPSVCSCQSLRDAVTITNTGDYASTYDITTNIDAATPAQQTTRLQPGQQTTIPIYIEKPCNAAPSQQHYTVTTTDTYGQTQRITRTLTTNKCQSLQATLYRNTTTTINPCQPLPYQIQTTNPAPFQEQYTVTADGNTIDTFTLQPGNTRTTNTTLQYQCKAYGDQTPAFTVTAQNNDVQTTLTDDITIRRNYPHTIQQTSTTPSPQPTCTDETLTATYTITNNAPFNNTYTVNTGLTTNTSELTVQPGTTKAFTAKTTSPEPTTENHTITITSRRGDITTEKRLTATFTECYNTTVNAPETRSYCAGNNHYPLTITNNNRFTTTYQTTITSEANATFTDQTTQLSPGEQRTIHTPFTADPTGTEQRPITTTTTYQHRSGQTTTHTTNETITLHDTYQCTKADTPTTTQANYDETLTVPVTNNGIHTATYTFQTNTSTFTPWQPNLTIPGGHTSYLVLNHDENRSTDLTETIHLTATNTENGYEYHNDITITLTPTPWYESLAEYIQDTPCAQALTVLLALIILGLLTLQLTAVSATTTTALNTAAVIGIILLAATNGLPPILETTPTTTTTPNGIQTTTLTNTTATINLNDYFTDPDNDALTYTTSDPTPFNAVIHDDQLTVTTPSTPTTTNTTITATDQANATTTIQATLTAQTPKTLTETYEANCHYLNWALLIILALTVANRTKTNGERRNDETITEDKTTSTDETEDNSESEHQSNTASDDELFDAADAPTSDNTVKEIKAWLDDHSIDYTSNMRKDDLLSLVDDHTDNA